MLTVRSPPLTSSYLLPYLPCVCFPGHLISVLQEGTAVGGKKPWSLVDGGGEDVVKHEEGGKHEAKQLFSVEVLSSKDSVEVRVEEKVCLI